MILLTAFNSAYAEIGSLCVQSIMRYTRLHPHMRFVSRMIPDNYDRPASWKKVDFIREHLAKSDYVFWIDCDALMVGQQDLMQLINPMVTINIARDENGLNNGVTCWRQCDEAFSVLDRLEAGYESHKDSPWFEQSVLHEIEDEIQVFEQPKHIWNSYPKEVAGGGDHTKDSLVLHFPGMSAEERLGAMKRYLT